MSLNKRMQFLEGESIFLAVLEPEYVDGRYPEWFNDAELCQGNSHHFFPYTRNEARKYVEMVSGSRNTIVLAIVLKKNEQHVGNISLQNINYINRSAELAIMIGEREVWGRGIGREAARLMLEHGFNELNMNRIYLGTLDNNIGMQRVALSCGMVQEGVKTQAVFKDGAYRDLYEYGIVASMFYCKHV